MSIGPILPGRLPSTMLSERLKVSLNDNARALMNLEQQVATGAEIFDCQRVSWCGAAYNYSADHFGTPATVSGKYQHQYQFMSLSEAALSSVGDALKPGEITFADRYRHDCD